MVGGGKNQNKHNKKYFNGIKNVLTRVYFLISHHVV